MTRYIRKEVISEDNPSSSVHNQKKKKTLFQKALSLFSYLLDIQVEILIFIGVLCFITVIITCVQMLLQI